MIVFTTTAWTLYAGQDGEAEPGILREEAFRFPALTDGEALIEPLYGSWEANMSHAIARSPIDVCRQRDEARVVLGNAGVVRVLAVAPSTSDIAAGDVCIFLSSGTCDSFGYMELAHAYDRPNSIGLLAKQTKAPTRNLVKIPADSRYSLRQWAVFAGKYLTAWSNWRVALGALRLHLTATDLPRPFVWGWGGGTTLAELDLARRSDCETTMISGRDDHLAEIAALGVGTLDRRLFPALAFDESRFADDAVYAGAYQAAEAKFLHEVARRTSGTGVSIFIDYIGAPVVRATLRSLARQGVLTTAGWKCGMKTKLNRAVECIQRHVHVHTHYVRLSEVTDAIEYGERTGWMPPEPTVYAWGDVPSLAARHAAGDLPSYFSVFAVNPM